MAIKHKAGGAYSDIVGVFHKASGVYSAVQVVFCKVAGVYQQVDAINASAVSASGAGSSITVTWTTAVATYSRVQFGTVSGVYTGQVDDIVSAVTSHSVVLDAADGIVAGQSYFYRVGSSSNGISWSYSAEYSVATMPPSVADFDVAASATAGGWTNGQNITAITSQNSAITLNGTSGRYPTYNSADQSMRFSGTQVVSNESVTAFSEIIMVVTDTGTTSYLFVMTADDSSNAGPYIGTTNNGAQWRLNATQVNGRLSGQKQIIMVRVATDIAYLRTVGSGANDFEGSTAAVGIPQSFTKFSIPERAGQGDAGSIYVHEAILCSALTAEQRTQWINLLKTKWGI